MVKLSCNVKALPCLLKTAPQAHNPIQVQDDPKALYRKTHSGKLKALEVLCPWEQLEDKSFQMQATIVYPVV